MQKNQLKQRGITFAEVLIVMGIIATLSGILWMVLAPKVMQSARTAAITGGLKQAAAALAIYRGDNNDAFPDDWRDMGFEKPNLPKYIALGSVRTLSAPPSYPESWRTQESTGLTELSYLYHVGIRSLISKYEPRYWFDEHEHPTFAAKFFEKLSPGNESAWSFVPPDMTVFTGNGKVKARKRLGGYTDGHVKWGPEFELWEMELLYKMEFEGLSK
jgi:type II secretory pathway pseudopilin PulG